MSWASDALSTSKKPQDNNQPIEESSPTSSNWASAALSQNKETPKETVGKVSNLPSFLGGGSYANPIPNVLTKVDRGYAGLNTKTGWERDHIVPVSLGGTSEKDNLQMLEGYTAGSKSNGEADSKDRVVKYVANEYSAGRMPLNVARSSVINWKDFQIPGKEAYSQPKGFWGSLFSKDTYSFNNIRSTIGLDPQESKGTELGIEQPKIDEEGNVSALKIKTPEGHGLVGSATGIFGSLFNVTMGGLEHVGNAGNKFLDMITSPLTDKITGQEHESSSLAKNVATTVNFGTSLGGIIPQWMAFNASVTAAENSNIPFVREAGKLTNTLFEGIGLWSSKGVEAGINKTSLSDETKSILVQPISDLVAFGVQYGIFHAIGKGTEKTVGKYETTSDGYTKYTPGAIDQMNISPEAKMNLKSGVKGGIGFAMDPLRTSMDAVKTMSQKITERVKARQKEGVEIDINEAAKITSEVAKETPIDIPMQMQVTTGSGKVLNIDTQQGLVLKTLIKGNEDLSFKKVNNFGKDTNGNEISARFEWDYQNKKATILYTKDTPLGDLIHEFGHYMDRNMASEIGQKLSDILPEYGKDKKATRDINASLGGYAANKLQLEQEVAANTSYERSLQKGRKPDLNRYEAKYKKEITPEMINAEIKKLVEKLHQQIYDLTGGPEASIFPKNEGENSIKINGEKLTNEANSLGEKFYKLRDKYGYDDKRSQEALKLYNESIKKLEIARNPTGLTGIKNISSETLNFLWEATSSNSKETFDNLTPSVINELSKFKPERDVVLYRGISKDSFEGGKYSFWTYDKNIAEQWAEGGKVLTQKFSPSEIIYDSTRISKKLRDTIYGNESKGLDETNSMEEVIVRDKNSKENSIKVNAKVEELGKKVNELNKRFVENPTPANKKALESVKKAYKEAQTENAITTKEGNTNKIVNESRADIGEKMATAIRNILVNPEAARKISPELTDYIKHQSQFMGWMSDRLSHVAVDNKFIGKTDTSENSTKTNNRTIVKEKKMSSGQPQELSFSKPTSDGIQVSSGKGITTEAFNSKKVNAPEDITKVLDEVAQANNNFSEARRSTTLEEMKDFSRKFLGNENQYQNLPQEIIQSRGKMLAAEQMMVDLASDLNKSLKTLDPNKPEALADIKDKLLRLQGTMASFSGARTEASHIFSSLRIGMIPGENSILTELAGQLKAVDMKAAGSIENFISGVNKEIGIKGIENSILKKRGKPLTEEEITNVKKKIDKVNELEPYTNNFENFMDNQKNVLDYFKARKDMETYIQELAPSTNLKVFTSTIGRGMMLFSLKSPITNIIGNTSTGILQSAIRRFSTGQFKGANGEYALDYVKFVNKVFNDTGFDISRMIKFEPKFKVMGEERTTTQGPGPVRAVGRFMEDLVFKKMQGAPDVLFSSFHSADSMNLASTKIAQGEGLKGEKMQERALELFKDASSLEPKTEEGKAIRNQAIADASYATYQNDSHASKVAIQLREGINFATGDLRLGDLNMPFVKTPANVISSGIEHSGGSILTGIMDMKKSIEFSKEGNKTEQKNAIQKAVRGFVTAGVGLTVATLIASTLKKDDFIGIYASNPKESKMMSMLGGGDNMIRIGGKWVSLEYFGPIGPPIAGLMYAKKYGTNWHDNLLRYLEGVGTQAIRMPGINELRGMLANIDAGIKVGTTEKDVLNGVSAFLIDFIKSRTIPGIVNDVAKLTDNYERQSNNKLEQIQAGIPFLRKGLKEKVDVLGDPIETSGGINPLIFGARVKSSIESNIRNFLTENNLSISAPSKTTKIETPDGGKRQLTEDEFYEYTKISGGLIKQNIELELEDLKQMDQDSQQKRINSIVSHAHSDALLQLEEKQ